VNTEVFLNTSNIVTLQLQASRAVLSGIVSDLYFDPDHFSWDISGFIQTLQGLPGKTQQLFAIMFYTSLLVNTHSFRSVQSMLLTESLQEL
jgi:hypothetical protein